jgi:hypothetical protein
LLLGNLGQQGGILAESFNGVLALDILDKELKLIDHFHEFLTSLIPERQRVLPHRIFLQLLKDSKMDRHHLVGKKLVDMRPIEKLVVDQEHVAVVMGADHEPHVLEEDLA